MMLTIFTPTYNRGHLLNRIYQSLLEQECLDFEWLIVDDGSTDDTELIVKSFIDENKINIRYIYKENGGKHTAHNSAVINADGEMFLCLDSDDQLAPNAVKIINQAKSRIQDNDCGFIGYKQDTTGKLLSSKLADNENIHCGLFRLTKNQNISGEFAFVFLTEILKKYLFPVFESERFIGECILYDKLELEGYTLCPLGQVIELCEYQSDGLSNNLNAVMKKNPAGYCLYYMQRIDMQDSLKNRIITAGKYKCFCIFAKDKYTEYNGIHKKSVALCTPLGILFWIYYKILRGF